MERDLKSGKSDPKIRSRARDVLYDFKLGNYSNEDFSCKLLVAPWLLSATTSIPDCRVDLLACHARSRNRFSRLQLESMLHLNQPFLHPFTTTLAEGAIYSCR